MRTSRLVALTLVATALVVPPAAAVDETCHDRPATHVGAPGEEIHATDGDDVIVTNGASFTDAGAGNDLVCVTGGRPGGDQDVVAGEGDDVVDATASAAGRVYALLGSGDDSFTGGARPDHVTASDPWTRPRSEGTDTIDTGGGRDLVITGGGRDHDRIDLGDGSDMVWVQGPMAVDALIVGGAGSDSLELDRILLRRELVIDNRVGTATEDGTPVVRWDGFERFRLSAIGPWQAPSFIGGPGDERLWTGIALTSVDMGGGDDLVDLDFQDRRRVDGVAYDGGPGTDAFILYSGPGSSARRVVLDVPADRLVFAIHDEPVHASIDGFEAHRLAAEQLRYTGTTGTDVLTWTACHGSVELGAGNDLAVGRSLPDVGCGYPVSAADIPIHGGAGDDVLVGGREPDILLGGPGEDTADGRGADDRCVAEVVSRC